MSKTAVSSEDFVGDCSSFFTHGLCETHLFEKMFRSFNENTLFYYVTPNWHVYCHYKLHNFDEDAGGFIG